MHVEQVRPAQLADWAARQAAANPLLLDVREAPELAIASVRPAGLELLHMPMSSMPQALAALDPARPVACLCHHGVRSQRVAMYLVQQGFELVVNVAGGTDAWSLEYDATLPRY